MYPYRMMPSQKLIEEDFDLGTHFCELMMEMSVQCDPIRKYFIFWSDYIHITVSSKLALLVCWETSFLHYKITVIQITQGISHIRCHYNMKPKDKLLVNEKFIMNPVRNSPIERICLLFIRYCNVLDPFDVNLQSLVHSARNFR